MYFLVSNFVSVLVVFIFLYIVWELVSCHQMFLNYSEKKSPFECGFSMKEGARLPFSLRFFLLVILFLMFDVELSILLQFPYQMKNLFFKDYFPYVVVILILMLGLFEEWRRGALDWSN